MRAAILSMLLCGLVPSIHAAKPAQVDSPFNPEENIAATFKTAKAEGTKFSSLPQAEKDRARALVQPAQTDGWVDRVAKPAGLDGPAMQALVDKAIAKYDTQGSLKRFDELAAEA